jgi:hypothetical protein
MQLQPVSSPFVANPRLNSPTYENPAFALAEGGGRQLSSGNSNSMVRVNATLEAEYYSSQKYAIEFTSKDGDKVSFSMESVQYQKALLEVDAQGSPEEMQKVIDFIKKQYADMKNEVLKQFIKSQGGEVEEPGETEGTEELAIPEFWNAENTSQRIVDFALQFYDAFQGAGEDFLKIIKDAIEKGFAEAKDMLGELPDPVSKLINDTHDLIMQKLDAWAEEKGINATDSEEPAITVNEPSAVAA